MSLTLRSARPSDRPFVVDLGVAELGGYGPHAWQLGAVFDCGEVRTSIAEEDGEPVGFSMAVIDEAGNVEAGALAVRPDQRRRGTGRLLMQELADLATARDAALVLNVAEDNRPARALFEQFGFYEVAYVGLYPSGQRSLRLVLPCAR